MRVENDIFNFVTGDVDESVDVGDDVDDVDVDSGSRTMTGAASGIMGAGVEHDAVVWHSSPSPFFMWSLL